MIRIWKIRTAGTRILGDTLSDIRPTRKTMGRAPAFEIMFYVYHIDLYSVALRFSNDYIQM